MNSTVMQRTPVNKRGKVSAMKMTLGMAISPFGNFVGGMLGGSMESKGNHVCKCIIGCHYCVCYCDSSYCQRVFKL